MIDFCKYVDVFLGCSEIDLPAPQGVAATWKFIKGITGNTSPGAALPFGKYSCCTYTAGYPTGYGDQLPNSNPQNLKHTDECKKFLGLSHFQQSGTGAIDYYYNYCIIAPFFGDPATFKGTDIEDEYAHPGYYAVKTADGICSETTVSAKSAYHRFRFPQEVGKLAVDFTNDGLLKKSERDYARPESGLIRIVSDRSVCRNHTQRCAHLFLPATQKCKGGFAVAEQPLHSGQGNFVRQNRRHLRRVHRSRRRNG